jgi:hypothetical protein
MKKTQALLLVLSLLSACAPAEEAPPAPPDTIEGAYTGDARLYIADVFTSSTPQAARISLNAGGGYTLSLGGDTVCVHTHEVFVATVPDDLGEYQINAALKTCSNAGTTDTVTVFGHLSADRHTLSFQTYVENPIDGVYFFDFVGVRP